jgi:glycosyltransferase involved in cell wall biosynthesis
MITFPGTILVIPTYNCGNQIYNLLAKLKNINIENHFEFVLLIDNCSQDRTVDIARNFYLENQIKWLKLAKNKKNYGLGGTHKAAIEFCIQSSYKNLAILHGDDQGDITDLLATAPEILSNENCAAFLGARFMTGSKLIGYSKVRVVGNFLLNLLMSIATARKIHDMGSGVNFFRVPELVNIGVFSLPDDLTFNNKLILTLCKHKKEFIYFPIKWSETDQISNAKLVHQSLKILAMITSHALKIKDSIEIKENNYEFDILNA